MHVIGTAGHVDHGKSSLVRALTGTDPDRWIEEQLRGMTLDLGFAHLVYPDGTEAGIVDVPGHERYLHNMLAGASGMDLVLLVIAANEGVRPQTLEHLGILAYLNVRRTIVVVTKCDLVNAAERAAVTTAIERALTGTIAAGAPLVAVSTTTGEGLDALRAAIFAALDGLTPRASDAPAFLPIDRVFTLPGRGTIVTGTLAQGTLRVGETLRLTPPDREVRIRSLHVFGSARDVVAAGARVAVNVPGVDVNELQRGAVFADAALDPQTAFRVRVRLSGRGDTAARRRLPVRVTLGALETLGTLVMPTVGDANADSNTEMFATLVLRQPLAAYPGQPFVLRTMSPLQLLGGGTVLGPGDPRARVVDAAAQTVDDHDDARDDPELATLLRVVAEAGIAGASIEQLAARANLRPQRVEQLAADAAAQGALRTVKKPTTYIDVTAADELSARIAAALTRREAESPWMLGATLLALARELAIDEPFLQRFLAADAEAGRIGSRGGYYFTVGHTPQLNPEQRAFFERVATAGAHAPLAPVPFGDIADALRSARIAGIAQAFDTLVESGVLVRVGADIYRATQITEIRAKLEAAVRRDGPITAARFRDAIGTSRKFALPLLEWLDATGVTVRDGDLRRLRDR